LSGPSIIKGKREEGRGCGGMAWSKPVAKPGWRYGPTRRVEKERAYSFLNIARIQLITRETTKKGWGNPTVNNA